MYDEIDALELTRNRLLEKVSKDHKKTVRLVALSVATAILAIAASIYERLA